MEVLGNMFGIVRFVMWVQTWVISGWGCGGLMGGGGLVDLADHCWISGRGTSFGQVLDHG